MSLKKSADSRGNRHTNFQTLFYMKTEKHALQYSINYAFCIWVRFCKTEKIIIIMNNINIDNAMPLWYFCCVFVQGGFPELNVTTKEIYWIKWGMVASAFVACIQT